MDRENSIEVLLVIIALMGAIFFGWSIQNDEYKDGQVDALTGNIKYELTEHPDSTKTWEEIGD